MLEQQQQFGNVVAAVGGVVVAPGVVQALVVRDYVLITETPGYWYFLSATKMSTFI